MKTKILLFALLGMFFLSCSEENVKESPTTTERKIAAIKTFTNVQEERMAFGILSNEEKSIFWNQKLDGIIANEKLNTNQVALIKRLKEMVNPEIWNNKSDYHAKFVSIDIKDFLKEAEKSFTIRQIQTYFFSINTSVADLAKNDPTDPRTCGCLKSETTGWDCGVLNDSWCTKPGSCGRVDGCGALNSSFCDGRCS